MKSATVIVPLALLLKHTCFSQGQELCPFQLYVWEGGSGCEGEYTSRSLIYADGQCRIDDALNGPGMYRAACSADGSKLLLPESGCILDNCAPGSTTNDSNSTELLCLADQSSISALYSALDEPELAFDAAEPVAADNLDSPVMRGACMVIQRQDTNVSVSFVLFGSCEDFNCRDGVRVVDDNNQNTSAADGGDNDGSSVTAQQSQDGASNASQSWTLSVAAVVLLGLTIIAG